jgi:UDP-N-acetyl-2-amino-2-deoxyglucuronate dehydrogenase
VFKHAIIGCGVISGVHAQCLGFVKGSKLVAVMDVVGKKAKALGEKFDVPWYTDRDKMLAAEAIDIIHVCTPSGNHHEIAVWAAKHKKHCFCEKPMDITLEAMDMIRKAFAKSGTQYCGCFMNRYNPAAQKLKQAVEQGRFGRITTATAQCMWWRSQKYYDSGEWRGTWELDGGGCLMNQGVHYVDLLQWLVGSPVKTIRAYAGLLAHKRIAVEDTAVAILKFENGALGVIHGSTASYPGPHGTVEICGDGGNATYEGKIVRWEFAKARPSDKKILATHGMPAKLRGKKSGTGSDPSALGDFHVMFAAAFKDFTDALRTGKPIMLDADEHRKAVDIILGIYESARLGGEEVSLPLKKSKVPVPLALAPGTKLVRPKTPPLPEAMKAFAKKQRAAKAKKARKAAKKKR